MVEQACKNVQNQTQVMANFKLSKPELVTIIMAGVSIDCSTDKSVLLSFSQI